MRHTAASCFPKGVEALGRSRSRARRRQCQRLLRLNLRSSRRRLCAARSSSSGVIPRRIHLVVSISRCRIRGVTHWSPDFLPPGEPGNQPSSLLNHTFPPATVVAPRSAPPERVPCLRASWRRSMHHHAGGSAFFQARAIAGKPRAYHAASHHSVACRGCPT